MHHEDLDIELERMATHSAEPQPAEPPELERRLIMPWHQRVGLGVLVTLVVVAMLGFFDPVETIVERTGSAFDSSARFSARLRDHYPMLLEVVVRNRSSETRDFVVRLPQSYLESFSEVDVRPPVDSGYAITLDDVPPGGEKRVIVQGAAESSFMRRGEVVVSAGDEAARLPIETFVYP